MATPTSSRRFSRFQPASTASVASEVEPTVSASVGHDHWANDVLKAVDKAASYDGSAGSNSPESYCDSETGGRLLDSVEVIKAKVLEKKRKFHTGRSLELKNLPDGCVEQVGLILAVFFDLKLDGRFTNCATYMQRRSSRCSLRAKRLKIHVCFFVIFMSAAR